MGSKDIGERGEALAAGYLRRRGLRILERRYRCRYGEIDLIAEEAGVLCFVEVKTRTGLSMALPREHVDRRKQQRLRAAAEQYLSERGAGDRPARFDVAELYVDGRGRAYIHYIENAF